MAKSTRQYVFEGMELLPEALIPFVEKRLESSLTGHWQVQVVEKLPGLRPNSRGEIAWDQSALFNAMDRFWMDAFKAVLGRAERSLVNELVDVRNKLSHNETFTYDDAERALDSMRRLMESISAGEVAAELAKMRDTMSYLRQLNRGETNCRFFQIVAQPVLMQEVVDQGDLGGRRWAQIEVRRNASVRGLAILIDRRELQLLGNDMRLAGRGQPAILHAVFE